MVVTRTSLSKLMGARTSPVSQVVTWGTVLDCWMVAREGLGSMVWAIRTRDSTVRIRSSISG